MSNCHTIHRHDCERCGTIWEHDPDTINKTQRQIAHHCPRCKGPQFYLYHGNEPPEFKQHHLKREYDIKEHPMYPGKYYIAWYGKMLPKRSDLKRLSLREAQKLLVKILKNKVSILE